MKRQVFFREIPKNLLCAVLNLAQIGAWDAFAYLGYPGHDLQRLEAATLQLPGWSI